MLIAPSEHVVRAILDNNSRGQTYMIDKYVDDQGAPLADLGGPR